MSGQQVQKPAVVNTIAALARTAKNPGAGLADPTVRGMLTSAASKTLKGAAKQEATTLLQKQADGQPLTATDLVTTAKLLAQAKTAEKPAAPDKQNVWGKMIEAFDNLDPNAGDGTPTFSERALDAIKGGASDILAETARKDPNVAKVLGNMSPAELNRTIEDVAAGDWTAAGKSAAILVIKGKLRDQLGEYFPAAEPFIDMALERMGLKVPQINEDGSLAQQLAVEDDVPPTMNASRRVLGPVGHKLADEIRVKLGPLEFEIPPATQNVIPVPGGNTGQVTPGAQAGISFRHMQNIATMLIPGGSPVYQSLGVSGHMLDFVGVFLGFNRFRPLRAEFTDQGIRDALNPDPLYVGSGDPKRPGNQYTGHGLGWDQGSWAVSRRFQDEIAKGMPLRFVMSTGITTIDYLVIVTSIERLFQRDDRTYYRIQGLAIGGGEGGDSGAEKRARAKTTQTVQAKAKADLNKRKGGKKKPTREAPTPWYPTPDGKLPVTTLAKGKGQAARVLTTPDNAALLSIVRSAEATYGAFYTSYTDVLWGERVEDTEAAQKAQKRLPLTTPAQKSQAKIKYQRTKRLETAAYARLNAVGTRVTDAIKKLDAVINGGGAYAVNYNKKSELEAAQQSVDRMMTRIRANSARLTDVYTRLLR